MCMVSMIGDDFLKRQQHHGNWYDPANSNNPTRAEFEALKKEIQELKKLLVAAKEYDAATGQPDCEQDDKIELMKKLADLVGVDLSEVW